MFNPVKKEVEIISFDVPYPPDYGGVIDVYFKVKAFRKTDIKVNMHCFEYGRKPSQELESLCENVYYYKRNVSKTNLFQRRPYIVATRASENLVKNLNKNNNPILFEGLHTCFYLDDKRLKKRRKIVRTHNIEHDYYQNLGRVEKDVFKKYYFSNEAQRLRRYEKILDNAEGIAAISLHDKEYFAKKYKNAAVVSAFHPHEVVDIESGIGNYALYHGSLSVNENNEAALFLINKIFSEIDVPLIIAGNKPSHELRVAVEKYKNITLKTDISTSEIYSLIKGAQINILPTFQATGIKLKLLAALYTGRHCIVNDPMVGNTGLESICIIKNSAEEMKKSVLDYFTKPFNAENICERKHVLDGSIYSNSYNINQLAGMLFP